MRLWHESDVASGCTKNCIKKGASRALAIRPGDQRTLHFAVGPAEVVQDRPRSLGAELHREATLLRDVIERLLIRQGRRRDSASYVFLISIARVIGPTPPGFGVSQPATSSTPGPRSPTCRPPDQFVLTSTTAAPGLIISLVIRLSFPAAATRMSPVRVWLARSLLRVLQTVTVALRFSSSIAVGFPTRLLRPTTTACAPSILTPP